MKDTVFEKKIALPAHWANVRRTSTKKWNKYGELWLTLEWLWYSASGWRLVGDDDTVLHWRFSLCFDEKIFVEMFSVENFRENFRLDRQFIIVLLCLFCWCMHDLCRDDILFSTSETKQKYIVRFNSY